MHFMGAPRGYAIISTWQSASGADDGSNPDSAGTSLPESVWVAAQEPLAFLEGIQSVLQEGQELLGARDRILWMAPGAQLADSRLLPLQALARISDVSVDGLRVRGGHGPATFHAEKLSGSAPRSAPLRGLFP